MPVKNPVVRPIMNPVITPTTTTKLPTAKQLKNALGAYEFQNMVNWSTKKPAGAVLKDITVQKPPPKGQTGDSIIAHVLKSDPSKVYFEKGGSTMPRYFGPVSWQAIPKGIPTPIMNVPHP